MWLWAEARSRKTRLPIVLPAFGLGQCVYGGTIARGRTTLRERWLSMVRTQRSKKTGSRGR